ncbi:uncharacterized protein LOC115881780 [Sitophilus oryzae]|uniref:Uncharacterized protein LOC115881780 n=1 Tax=Sitophilus oryzae TaxID=7048 RepID=A0A6J2XXC5_SITOR|nr:uncharacterized protein LOC115881780 [Sitophilus oryzae]
MIRDTRGITKVWREYCEKLFYERDKDECHTPEFETIDREPTILKAEVEKAIRSLKNNKSPGEDGISAETIKSMDDLGIDTFHKLCVMIWQTGKWPREWCESIYMPLHKKGSPTYCSNYRTIALMSHAKYNRPLALVFVDFQKAFDTVELTSIIAALEQGRVDYRYTRLIEYIYSNATTTVKLHETTDKIEVGKGVRQGYTISPKLFTAVLEYAMKSLSWENRGINIDGERLTHLRFADDIVLVSDNIGDSKQMLEELVQASLKVGLRINTSKTQIMTNLVLTQNIRIGDADIKETHIYKYLGHEIQIGKNNQIHEIQRRIGLGWAAFGKLRETFKSDIPICLKRKVYEQCVLPLQAYFGKEKKEKRAKTNCYPNCTRISEKVSTINLQSLLSHTSRRLIESQKEVLSSFASNGDDSSIKLNLYDK